MHNLDNTDKKILNLLQKDGQLSVKEISSKVNLSVTPTFNRIKKLEDTGVIDRYIAILDKKKINKNLTAFCNVVLIDNTHSLLKKFEADTKSIEEIMEVHCMSGLYDYLLKIVVMDINEYYSFVNFKLSELKNIKKIEGSFVLNEIKWDTCYKLA